MEGCRWKWAANGPEQASGAAETMELAGSWTSFSQDQGNAPTACAKGDVGLSHTYPRFKKRKIPDNS